MCRWSLAVETALIAKIRQVALGAAERLSAGQVIAALTEPHRPVDDAAGRPENERDTEARTQLTLLHLLAVGAAQLVSDDRDLTGV